MKNSVKDREAPYSRRKKSRTDALVADFNLRKTGYADAAFPLQLPANVSSEYIPVHLFADELPIGEEASQVDCYWRVDSQVYFVQTVSKRMSSQPLGLYYRRDCKSKPEMVYLMAVIDSVGIQRKDVEFVLNTFAAIGFDKLSQAAPGQSYVVLQKIETQPS